MESQCGDRCGGDAYSRSLPSTPNPALSSNTHPWPVTTRTLTHMTPLAALHVTKVFSADGQRGHLVGRAAVQRRPWPDRKCGRTRCHAHAKIPPKSTRLAWSEESESGLQVVTLELSHLQHWSFQACSMLWTTCEAVGPCRMLPFTAEKLVNDKLSISSFT